LRVRPKRCTTVHRAASAAGLADLERPVQTDCYQSNGTSTEPCADDTAETAKLHHDCFACGPGSGGLGLVFDRDGPDAVWAEWFCDEKYQGYPGIVHGGIIATILDSAMTNCLLTKGISAVTAKMQVDYAQPLRIGSMITVRASLTRSRPPLFVLVEQVTQDGSVCAKATAKFMSRDVWSVTSDVLQ